MKVLWTENALEHLKSIHRYIERSSPTYAKRMVDRLTSRSIQIADFPLSGRMVPEIQKKQIREVIEPPYRMIYHVLPDRIEVLAVIHSAQQFDW